MRRSKKFSFEQLSKIYAFLAQAVSIEHDYSKLIALKSALDFGLVVAAAKIMILEKISVPPPRPEYGNDVVGFRIVPLYSQLSMFTFTTEEVDTALNELAGKKIRFRYDQSNGTMGILPMVKRRKNRKKAE